MFCKECGAEIPDDSKHCSECGAKLVEDAPVVEAKTEEKESFFKRNKKKMIVCVIGLIIIFGIVAFLTSDSHTNGFRKIYVGYYDDFQDKGYTGYMKDKNKTSYFTSYTKDNSKVNVEINEGNKLNDWIVPESENMTINGIDGVYTKFEGSNFFAYNDNDCTVVMSSESMNDLKSSVKDY